MAKSKLKTIYNRQEFPHNSRKIAAGLRLMFLGLLGTFLVISLLPVLPTDLAFEQAKITVMLSPYDAPSHLVLAQEYLKRGNMEAVERELTLTQNLQNSNSSISSISSNSTSSPISPNSSTVPSVLGSSLSPAKIWEKIKNEPQRIKNEVAFWEKVIAENPDYRDGYLQLAMLNYQIYESKKAKDYLNKALEIDPNFEAVRALEKIIQ